MPTNDQFAQAVTRAGSALAELPLKDLPPLASFDVRSAGLVAHVEGVLDPVDRTAVGRVDAVLAWAAVLPDASLHAVEDPDGTQGWHVSARCELGGVPTAFTCVTGPVPADVTRQVRHAPNPWTAATSLVHAMVVDAASTGSRRTSRR